MIRRKQHKYTQEQRQFLRDNITGTRYRKLCEMFNNEFGTDMSETMIRAYCGHMKMSNKLTGGSHGVEPPNKHLVGETTKRGRYHYLKVADTGDRLVDWQAKHLFLWEFHNGAVKPGKMIMFIDGDYDNITIDNLMEVTPGIAGIMKRDNHTTDNNDLNRAVVNLMEINLKIRKLEKK